MAYRSRRLHWKAKGINTRKKQGEEANSIARRGQGGDFVPFRLPLAGSRDSVPCGVWGNAPTVPRPTNSKEAANKGAGSEASLPVTSRSRRSAPKLLYQPLAHCRAKWARPNCLTSVSVCFPRTSSSIHHQKQTSTASHHAGLFFILLTFPAHPGWSAWAAPGLCPECTPGMPRSPADRHSPSR